MTIYARTEEGQQAAYSPQSALPRKLRSILKVIDAKTPLDVFEQSLHAFGDVKGILQSLDKAGLIKPLPAAAQHVRVTADLTETERERLMQPRNVQDWSATRSAYAPPSVSAHVPGNGQDGSSRQAQSTMHTALNPQYEQQKAAALKVAVDSMASFVLTYLPDQSIQILKEIEETSSLELLAVTLGGYEQMVSHVGEPAAQHVRELKQILRDNL